MLNPTLFSSRSCEWTTPQYFFDALDKRFHFTLDPCATPANAKCERYFTKADDGLRQKWTGRVFVNPPYGRTIGDRVKKLTTNHVHMLTWLYVCCRHGRIPAGGMTIG